MSILGSLGSTSGSYGQSGGQSQNAGYSIGGTMGSAQTAMQFSQAMMEAQQAYNSAEAQKQRDWQEKMANTAYQRAVKDMKAAGINPILAAGNGGAATPSGAAASSGMAQAFTDTYSQSENWGESSNWGFNSSYSYNNLAKILGTVADTIADQFGGMDALLQSAGLFASNTVNGITDIVGAAKDLLGIKEAYKSGGGSANKGAGVGRSDVQAYMRSNNSKKNNARGQYIK